MKKLQAYLNGLTTSEQTDFARRCGTTIGYLRKAISKGQKIGEGICINVERESRRFVQCEDLRVDVDWAYIRGTKTQFPAAVPTDRRVSTEPNSFPDLDRRAAVQGVA